MTTLVRWEPFFRDFSTLAGRLNRIFESSPWIDGERELLGGWYPAVDMYDHGSELVLKAELPGMRKGDIDIHVENNVLTVRGQRSRDEKISEDNYFRTERSYGSFTRSFTLPSTVDVKKIAANYKDGILTVTLPKAEEAKPRQIEVKVS
ncbi:MAG: Hsp20/alpha crystallin family protein [Candidatus Tectimicrobiota bacterium]